MNIVSLLTAISSALVGCQGEKSSLSPFHPIPENRQSKSIQLSCDSFQQSDEEIKAKGEAKLNLTVTLLGTESSAEVKTILIHNNIISTRKYMLAFRDDDDNYQLWSQESHLSIQVEINKKTGKILLFPTGRNREAIKGICSPLQATTQESR